MSIFYWGNIGRFRYLCGFGYYFLWRVLKRYKVVFLVLIWFKVFDWLYFELIFLGYYLFCIYYLNENIFFIRGLE